MMEKDFATVTLIAAQDDITGQEAYFYWVDQTSKGHTHVQDNYKICGQCRVDKARNIVDVVLEGAQMTKKEFEEMINK